jgi:hypothetical protein
MDSKGHLFNIGTFEYFTDTHNIYRSPIDCPLDSIEGFKMGARFECPDSVNFRNMLKKIHNVKF